MKMLSADFSILSKGYNVAICILSDEGESKIKSIEVFETDCKLEDIAGFIIDKFKLLKCDYVVIDPIGLGVVINDILKGKLGCKVKTYNSYTIDEHKMICGLHKNKILKELGLELKCEVCNGLLRFIRKDYTDFEYLMVKSIGMANKLLNEVEEYKPIDISVESNVNILIEDLAKEIEKMVTKAYKEIANDCYDEFKYNMNNKIDDVLQTVKEKERFELSTIERLKNNLDYYEKTNRSDLYKTVKRELENLNDDSKFLFDLIVDIEKIKGMLDEM